MNMLLDSALIVVATSSAVHSLLVTMVRWLSVRNSQFGKDSVQYPFWDILFEDNNGHTVTVTDERYVAMLN
jgi:hypothetical protein